MALSFEPKPILGRKPTVPEVLPIANAFYSLPGNAVGGVLHIVLEDNNVADSHVQYCRDIAVAQADEPGFFLASLLMLMSKTQRSKIAINRSPILVFDSDNPFNEQGFWAVVRNSLGPS